MRLRRNDSIMRFHGSHALLLPASSGSAVAWFGLVLVAISPGFLLAQAPPDPLGPAIELYFDGETSAAADEFARLAEVLSQEGDLENAARGFNNACLALGNVGQLERAVNNCRSAVELRRRQGNVFGEARALNNLALALQRAGDLNRARDLFREALARNLEIDEREGAVINRQNLAALAWARGRYDEALGEFREAERLSLDSAEDWSAAQARIARQNQGAVLATLGNDREALDLYLALLDGALELPVVERAPLEYNAAVAYASLGDPREAVRRLEQSERMSAEVEDVFGAALAKVYRGWVLHDGLGRGAEAVASLEAALELAREAGGVAEEEAALGYLIEVLLDLGRAGEASAYLDDLLELSSASEQAGTRWSAAAGAARVAFAAGNLDDALDWARRAVEAVEATGGDVAEATDRARFVRSLRRVYSLAVDVFAAGHEAGREGAFEDALGVVVRAKARDLLSRLELERQMEGLSLARLRDRLGGATLIELFDAGDVLWRLVVSPERVALTEVPRRAELLAAGERVAGALTQQAEPNPRDLEALEILLGGVEVQGARLLVAPVGSLSRVPWEVLPVGGEELLVDVAVVGYLPSAALLFERRTSSSEREPWLAVASQGPDNPPTLRTLAPLRHVEEEVELLRQLGGEGGVLVDAEATAENLLARLRAPGAEVVHLATHAIVDERPGYGSMLLLEDQALRPDRIASTELNVGLAVLAACSTTLGSDPSGLVLQSLTGAWLAAGAESVVATLWDVDDETTLAFMQQFYAQLGRGLGPADALTAAKRRVRQDPRWTSAGWAAYVLTGVPSAPDTSPVAWIAAIVGALLALLVLAALLHRFPRRSRPLVPKRRADGSA